MVIRRSGVFAGTLSALALVTLLAGACGDDQTQTPTPTPSSCTDPWQVSLPNCDLAGADPFSDEACVSLDDRLSRVPAVADDARAPSILAPTQDEAAPASTPFTFRWAAPVAWLPPAEPTAWPRRPPTLGDELARWGALVPEAEAHCAPFNGRGYELVFKLAGQTILRRLQSATTWTPDAPTWSRLATSVAGRPVELTIITAIFSNSAVSTSGAYVQTAPRRFTLVR